MTLSKALIHCLRQKTKEIASEEYIKEENEKLKLEQESSIESKGMSKQPNERSKPPRGGYIAHTFVNSRSLLLRFHGENHRIWIVVVITRARALSLVLSV